jgi:hypothetical protein
MLSVPLTLARSLLSHRKKRILWKQMEDLQIKIELQQVLTGRSRVGQVEQQPQEQNEDTDK